MPARFLSAAALSSWISVLGCGAERWGNGHRCKGDDQCTSGYCECPSACRFGCCRPKPIEPVGCTADCNDVPCSP
jgi:hypothetical protein